MFLNSFPFTTVYFKTIVIFYVLHREKKKAWEKLTYTIPNICAYA